MIKRLILAVTASFTLTACIANQPDVKIASDWCSKQNGEYRDHATIRYNNLSPSCKIQMYKGNFKDGMVSVYFKKKPNYETGVVEVWTYKLKFYKLDKGEMIGTYQSKMGDNAPYFN
jgi:hypothetical protein